MPRTDEQIAKYMEYYSGTTERKWALENLCRVENKTPEEVTEICTQFGVKIKPPAYCKYSEELVAKVVNDKEAGMNVPKIADKHDLPMKTVQNIVYAHQARKRNRFEEPVELENVHDAERVPQIADTKEGFWCAVLDRLKEFASGVVGAGAKFTGLKADEKDEYAQVLLRTADGKAIHFTVCTIPKINKENTNG